MDDKAVNVFDLNSILPSFTHSSTNWVVRLQHIVSIAISRKPQGIVLAEHTLIKKTSRDSFGEQTLTKETSRDSF